MDLFWGHYLDSNGWVIKTLTKYILQAHEMLWFSENRKQMVATIDQLIHRLPVCILL
jgi:hypothetical protein